MLIDLNELDKHQIKYPKEWRSLPRVGEIIHGLRDMFLVNTDVVYEEIQLLLLKKALSNYEFIKNPCKKAKLLYALMTKI